MLLTPLVFLILLEAALRLFQYGPNLDLVVRKNVFGREYYTVNRDVGKRYFTNRTAFIPEAHDDIFIVNKGSHSKRIFMLGESTMAGFPFDYDATAPDFLRDRLSRLLPNDTIEVINLGISAINSYTILDLMKELVNYQPDAFVVYLGHNEFYGAFGVGSTEYLGKWRSAVNLYISLRDYKIFLLIRDGIIGIKNIISPPVTRRGSTLMEAMVAKDIIPYGSPDYRIALQNFEANYRDIIHIAKQHNVPLIISTLASNIRDQKPLLADFDQNTPWEKRHEWSEQYQRGGEAMKHNDFQAAIASFQNCIQIDSMQADGHYRLGQALDSVREYSGAREAYRKARDYDGMRFRASSDFNETIKRLSAEEGAPLCDVERAFEEASPHGLIGGTLMYEHLHPNADGYNLLAKQFALTLSDNSILTRRPEWQWNRDLTDEQYKGVAGYTQFELDAATYRIFYLTHSWPFTTENAAVFHAADRYQQLAVDYCQKKVGWSDAHYTLASWFEEAGKYEEALREDYAISKVVYYSYYPLMKMGDLERMIGKPDSAEALYHKGLDLQDTPYLHVRLGMLLFDGNRTDDAIREFEATFEPRHGGTQDMGSKDQSTARYLLGMAYGKAGKIEKAKSNFTLAVQIDPNNTDAKNMLLQLQ